MKFKIKEIVEMAISLAIAIILDRFLKINIGPTGGSINISLIPLLIFTLRHGLVKGFISLGLLFGLITCFLDGYGLVTYPLEYLLGFGCFSIVGLINHKNMRIKPELLLAFLIIVASVIRILCGTLDSMLIYEYKFIPGLVYNVSYIIPSTIIDITVIELLYPTIIRLSKRYKTDFMEKGKQL